MGKVAKADYIIYGSYRNFQNTLEVDIRVVNVKTTEILTIEHQKTHGKNKLVNLAEILAKKIIAKIEQ